MRTFISVLMMLLASFFLISGEVQAKRFGGGKSIGMQRNSQSFSRAQPLQSVGQTASRASRWAAPLMGLAAGALLASLFMGHGLGTALLSWFVIAVLCYFAFNLIRRFRTQNRQPAYHLNQSEMAHSAPSASDHRPQFFGSSTTANMPAGFDTETFLRDAKSLFIRLQTAYDQKDVNDLRKFTTPEVFAEIQLQLQERGHTENITEIVSLDNQLLDVSEQPQITLHGEVTVITASVRFSGSMREDQQPTVINEIWHFQKDRMGSEWTVAGLQQE